MKPVKAGFFIGGEESLKKQQFEGFQVFKMNKKMDMNLKDRPNFSLFVLLLLSIEVCGQIGFGGKTGGSFSSLIGSGYLPKPGFHIGFFVKTPVSERVYFQPEITFSQKGGQTNLKDVGKFYNPYDQQYYRREKLVLDYVDLSVLFRHNIRGGFHWLVGPKFSTLVNSRYKYTNGYKEKRSYRFQDARKFDLGIEAGIGYEAKNGFIGALRADLGLIPIAPYLRQYHNVSLSAAIGYVMFGKRRR